MTTIKNATKRMAQVVQLQSPLVPKYMFEAYIQCEPIASERKKQLLTALETELLPTQWNRNGQVFTQLIDVATGDLGLAENEFINAAKVCAETYLAPSELHILRITFNSSTVSLIDDPPPPMAPLPPFVPEPIPELIPPPPPQEEYIASYDPVTGQWS